MGLRDQNSHTKSRLHIKPCTFKSLPIRLLGLPRSEGARMVSKTSPQQKRPRLLRPYCPFWAPSDRRHPRGRDQIKGPALFTLGLAPPVLEPGLSCPERPLTAQTPATCYLYASSCHRWLEFAELHAPLCHSLIAPRSELSNPRSLELSDDPDFPRPDKRLSSPRQYSCPAPEPRRQPSFLYSQFCR
jgi:hypothetical protein